MIISKTVYDLAIIDAEADGFQKGYKRGLERGKENRANEPANPYWERITAIADRQRSKGLKEYGRGVEDDTADINVRLDRIEEELIDTLMYLEHLRDGVNQIKEVVK